MTALAQILILAVTTLVVPFALVSGATALGLLFVGPSFEAALQLYVPVLTANQLLFNFGLAGLCGVSLVLGLLRGELSLANAFNGASVPMLLLIMLSLVSMNWSGGDVESRRFITGSIPYSILYLGIAPLLIGRLADMRRIAVTVCIVGAAVALAIVLNPNVTLQTGRLDANLGGFRINPLALGFLGGMLFITALLYRPKRVGWFILPARIAIALLGVRLVLDSGSRGQLLLAGLLGVGLIPLSRPLKDPVRFFLSLVGVGVAVLVLRFAMTLFITNKNEERWTVDSISDGLGGRFELVGMSLSDFLASPQSWLLGRGAGRFTQLGSGSGAPYPHNFFVESLSELGFVGFALYVTLVVVTFRCGLRIWRRYQDDLENRMLATLLIAITAFSFLLTLKEGSIHDPGTKLFPLLVLVRLVKLDDASWFASEGEYDLDHDPEGSEGVDDHVGASPQV